MSQKISTNRFFKFAMIYGIDINRFNKANKIKEYLINVNNYCVSFFLT